MAYIILPSVNYVIFQDVPLMGLKMCTKLPLPVNYVVKTSILLQWIPHEIKQAN